MAATPPPPETLDGDLERFTFVNDDGSFAVALLQLDGGGRAAVVGALTGLEPGDRVRLVGHWQDNPRFGRQFKAEAAWPLLPESAEGLERYLAGGRVPGVGPELARRLVSAFGAETLQIIANSPERLAEVPGIGPKRRATLADSLTEQTLQREALVFLQGHGVPASLADKIWKRYGGRTVGWIRENPYRLAVEVRGVGFLTADRIARSVGLSADSPIRATAALIHTLTAAQDEGHVCLPRPLLLERTAALVGEGAPVAQVLDQALSEGRLVDGGDGLIYTRRTYHEEVEIALRLRLLERDAPPPLAVHLPKLQAASGLTLAPLQLEAVRAAADHGVLVLTGGPGTGKTTVIRTVLALFEEHDAKVRLAAPTGRAARRLAEATGHEASTVHRLLEYSPQDGGFRRDAEDPIDAAVVIVDEASMLDQPLCVALLRAIAPGTRLVLVGDADQLPSVGPGNVLADVIASEVVPVVRLAEIFRQAELSDIVVAAHHILAGRTPAPTPPGEERDFYLVEAQDGAHAAELVVQLVKDRIPARFNLDPLEDIQVLTPMHRGPCGAERLNALLQAALNPVGAPVGKGGALRQGDKVMQIRNDYEREVFNGDVGRILGREGDQLQVSFEGRTARYPAEGTEALVLAYACTIHKSQGSEYPAVVVPLVGEHWVMLQKNLLYTAVTRGRQLVVLVTQPRALQRAVRRQEGIERYTALARRLWAA